MSPESFRPAPPLTIGLLGGVASGKSTVAEMFARRGLVHLDADRVAREVVSRAPVLAAIRARFGPGVLTEDGDALDRAALAERVFGDPEELEALEAITHPRIHAELEHALDAALAAGSSVVLDIPLLLENGWVERCDACVFVDADEETREDRARARGWADRDLRRRERNQATLDAKRAVCEHAVRTSGSLDQTRRDVENVLSTLATRQSRGPDDA